MSLVLALACSSRKRESEQFLFLSYAVYRSLHPEAFRVASHATAITYGTANTLILITSSLIMTIAERAAIGGCAV
jgi:cytochrome c oxidase subunit III